MDILILIRSAREAGLKLAALPDGRLRITGPKGAAGIARALGERKPDVIRALADESTAEAASAARPDPLIVNGRIVGGHFDGQRAIAPAPDHGAPRLDSLHEYSPEEIAAIGPVPPGWHPRSWATHLRYMASRCDELRPDLSRYYRAWAAAIDRRKSGPAA